MQTQANTLKIELPPKLHPVFVGDADFRGAYGGRGSAKCLGKGTMLLRADASLVAVEDVKTGDKLMGPTGPRTVLSTTQGIGPLYRVDQITGMSYVCNDAHILVLERSESSRKDYGTISKAGNRQRENGRYNTYDTGRGYSLITAEEYANKPDRFKAQHFGFRRAFEGVHKALPVDPYLMGLWLGDGSSKAAEITNVDPEIIDFIYEISAANEWTVKKSANESKASRFYIGYDYQRGGSFLRQLRGAGVYDNKHIPECYFGASIEQRRALLAGLVDSDGHVSTGCIAVSQSKERMLDDIVRLAHGLGLKASKRKMNVKSSNGTMCVAWQTQIGGDINLLPLKIERKRLGSQVKKNKDWRRTRIDVTPIGIGAYYGFELDGDHLFMLADGTVTHNTRSFAKMVAIRAAIWAEEGREGAILCGRQYMNSLQESSMEEIKSTIREEPWLLERYDLGEGFVRTKDRRITFVFKGLDKNLDSIKGIARILLCWVDEAENVTELAWAKLIPTIREEGSEIWVTWNPEMEDSPTDKRFRKEATSRMKIVEMNYRDNPWFPSKLERDRLDDLEKRPNSYEWIWEGAYVVAHEGAYFAKDLAKAAREKRIGRVSADPLMSIKSYHDIGGTGRTSDAYSIWIVQFIDKEIRILDHYSSQGQSLSYHVAWMRERGWANAEIVLPHDGIDADLLIGKTYAQHWKDAGFSNVRIVPNMGPGAAKQRVEAMWRLFPRMWFNEETTRAGRKSLGWYHEKIHDKTRARMGPAHDWSSHDCDAAGLMAVDYKEPIHISALKIKMPNLGLA